MSYGWECRFILVLKTSENHCNQKDVQSQMDISDICILNEFLTVSSGIAIGFVFTRKKLNSISDLECTFWLAAEQGVGSWKIWIWTKASAWPGIADVDFAILSGFEMDGSVMNPGLIQNFKFRKGWILRRLTYLFGVCQATRRNQEKHLIKQTADCAGRKCWSLSPFFHAGSVSGLVCL